MTIRAPILLAVLLGAASATPADPMRPLAAPAAASAAEAADGSARARNAGTELPLLVAIREDAPGQRQVLIGERWFATGERLEQRRITAIGANHVEFSDGRRHTRQYLLPPLLPAQPQQAATAPRRPATSSRQP